MHPRGLLRLRLIRGWGIADGGRGGVIEGRVLFYFGTSDWKLIRWGKGSGLIEAGGLIYFGTSERGLITWGRVGVIRGWGLTGI